MYGSCDVCTKDASCACCIAAQYCSAACQDVAWKKHERTHKKQIQYIATGGIAGTTVHWILHPTGVLENVKQMNAPVQISMDVLHEIYNEADRANFYPESELSRPEGFDIPRYLYYYGDMVTTKEEVPELDYVFSRAIASLNKHTAIHSRSVRLGDVFEYELGTSAINYPSVSLSDGLKIMEQLDMEYNDQPGSTNVSVLRIKATKRGVQTITKTVRHPNRPADVFESRVVVK